MHTVCMATGWNRPSDSLSCLLLLLLALDMFANCIQVITVLLSAARASVVVLVLQALVAE